MQLVRDGVGLAYAEAGSGPDSLVFIHGAFADRSSFTEQFDHFARHHRVVLIELRGHGESDKPDEEYTIAGFADDVAWMIGELGLGDPVVIGHSLGGMVAVELVGRHKTGKAVITLDSPSVIPGWTLSHPGQFDERMRGPDFRSALTSFLVAAYLPIDDQVRLAESVERIGRVPEHVVKRTWDALMRWDPTPALQELEAPFLYLDHGQPDVDVKLLQSYCPQMLYGQTVGAGHRALQEVPDQVNAMLRRFIAHAPALAEYARAHQGGFRFHDGS